MQKKNNSVRGAEIKLIFRQFTYFACMYKHSKFHINKIHGHDYIYCILFSFLEVKGLWYAENSLSSLTERVWV